MKNQLPITERVYFLAGVTFLGGFLDTYTYITRGGVFANNHTANMAKLGISLAQGQWHTVIECLVPILACIFGAAASELVKSRTDKQQDWRKGALVVELLTLLFIGFVPISIPDIVVNTSLSFITGFQLCLFRSCKYGAHNTTICTGNLRSVGQLLYGAVSNKTRESFSKFVKYTCLAFSFVIGAAAGVPFCVKLGPAAALMGSMIVGCLLSAMLVNEKQLA